MKRLMVLAVLCFFAAFAGAEEPRKSVSGTLEFELSTPMRGQDAFGITMHTLEYNWRTVPLPFGRLSGYGMFEANDSDNEWMTRHTAAYAPFADAPFLALAVEYGARIGGQDYWQGGGQFIASRIPSVHDRFQYLALGYFSDIRGARFPSEWVLRAESTAVTMQFLSVFLEGIYRYRSSAERRDDAASVECWFFYAPFSDQLNAGFSFEKAGVEWMPYLGARVRF
ncbi:MAG: hypothetical protein HYT22_03905 [Candidatus Niyogibacteria bacterium]|nr:hypothetical protein [Candidatus Niyogibacteria bacterium]